MSHTVKLRNVDINVINNLLNQSLEVSSQLMFEFSPDMVKSVSFSVTKTFIKIWTIDISNLIKKVESEQENEGVGELNFGDEFDLVKESTKDFNKTFDFYLLKGENLRNFLSVFKNEIIDMEFHLIESNDNKLQAQSVIISGKTESDKSLVAKLDLTTEDMITNKVTDYSKILEVCKPKDNMSEIIMSNSNLKELRKVISNMNKTIVNNSSFVTFTIENNVLKVNDKVFDLTFDDVIINNVNEFSFNILKNDFKLIGNHSFRIFSSESSNEIHFATTYGNAVIWCLSSKPLTTTEILNNKSDDEIDSDDLDEYGLDFGDLDDDDLPF